MSGVPSAGGEVVSETLPFDGGRRVTAHLPVAAPEVIVFAGDGQLVAPWGAGFRPSGPLPDVLPRAYLVAGTEEPFFRDNAGRWAEAFAAAGADVVMIERPGGHGAASWRDELPAVISWLVG
ncbi:hypothetical protein [Actinomarinicola tropica]|uniref:hypothetical protein n=1 Tax=Actinomarinicola tropica TaxID=2789776 RepID=UPI001E403675|nr:hypothetical protein [Actinomarinicola tropica]